MVTTTNVQLAQLIAQLNIRGINISDPMAVHSLIAASVKGYVLHDRDGNRLDALIADYGADGYRVFLHVDAVSIDKEAEEIARLMQPF